MQTDNELLRSYVHEQSEQAFRELVERRINLVYSAALREAHGNVSEAEDISQAVFAELARNSQQLLHHPTLAGWLYTCVRHTAANVRRAQDRRQRREQEIFTMNQLLGSEPVDELWRELRPQLDDVMHELSDEDRTAIVLRFFEGRGFKEVGQALGLSENAARMKVERALEKMRTFLECRGIKSTGASLAAALAWAAVLSAPPALASTVATGALAAASNISSTTVAFPKRYGLKTVLSFVGAGLLTALIIWNRVSLNQKTARTESNQEMALAANSEPVATNSTSTRAATAAPGSLVRIVDADTGEPLANSKLYLFYLFQDGRGETTRRETDVEGKAAIPAIERPFWGLNLFVTAEGHVPKVTSFGYGRALPAEYIMKIERGVAIGGQVINEMGDPIPGAKVEFDGSQHRPTRADNIQFGPDTSTLTDAEGRWLCRMVPSELDRLVITATRPDYAQATIIVRPDRRETNNLVLTLSAGFSVAGIVLDEAANPIFGATVREVRKCAEDYPCGQAVTSDLAGKFGFRAINGGELVLVVQAESFAPEIRTLQVSNNLSVVQFQLRPGQILRGRVTDEMGSPVSDARIETRRGANVIRWATTTDGDGRFQWNSAPQEPLIYAFQVEGFDNYAAKLAADGTEHEIKLTPEREEDRIQLTGTVTDFDTGEPIDQFKVLWSSIEPQHSFVFNFATEGQNGTFKYLISARASRSLYKVQIQKDGYIPAVSETLSRDAGNQKLAFKLQKGTGPSGIVLLPNGEPAPNASVFLCTTEAALSLNGPLHFETGPDTTPYVKTTDIAGKFSLPAVLSPRFLIAIHEQGYGQVPLLGTGSTQQITLQAWGRIEGTLVLGGKAVASERIVAARQMNGFDEDARRFGFDPFFFETKTDSAGRFAYEKVPPGACHIFRQTLDGLTGFESHDTNVVIRPGETTQVTLGGSGRTVIGRALLPGGSEVINWRDVSVRLALKTGDWPKTFPVRENFASKEAYITAYTDFLDAFHSRLRYGTLCESDGSFRIADVPPGTYDLEIHLPNSAIVARHLGYSEAAAEIASLERSLTIPESAETDPFDLGSLPLARAEGAQTLDH